MLRQTDVMIHMLTIEMECYCRLMLCYYLFQWLFSAEKETVPVVIQCSVEEEGM